MKITSRGQVTIPAEIRKQTGPLPNTEVDFTVFGEQVIVRKAVHRRRGSRLVSHMRGRATRKMSTDEIMALTRG